MEDVVEESKVLNLEAAVQQEPESEAVNTLPTAYEFRNPYYSSVDLSTIDMEINHPIYGWLPFTASQTDVEPIGAIMYQAAIDSGNVGPYVAPPAAPYSLQISVMWSRMTDEEAEDFDAAMQVTPPLRLRKQFNTSMTMMSDSELFTFARAVAVTTIGETRTAIVFAE